MLLEPGGDSLDRKLTWGSIVTSWTIDATDTHLPLPQCSPEGSEQPAGPRALVLSTCSFTIVLIGREVSRVSTGIANGLLFLGGPAFHRIAVVSMRRKQVPSAESSCWS